MSKEQLIAEFYERNSKDRENPIIKELMEYMDYEKACEVYSHAHMFFIDEQETIKHLL